jgi:hypothetical protein
MYDDFVPAREYVGTDLAGSVLATKRETCPRSFISIYDLFAGKLSGS